MIEPEDVGELEDLYWGQREANHSLGAGEAYILVEGDEVAYLLIT